MQNLRNYFTTPNKMTSENDIKGLVSLKFLRPWAGVSTLAPRWAMDILFKNTANVINVH
jgi:hypothetical protein